MSKKLLNILMQKFPQYAYLDDVDYNTSLDMHCGVHGTYKKTVRQLLYKNPNCPICTRLERNRKLSEIGKTKIGSLNNFFGKHHSEETLQKLRRPCNDRTKVKISNTVRSKECQERIKNTCLQKYGVEHYSKTVEYVKKFKATNLQKFGTPTPAQNVEIAAKISKSHQNRSISQKTATSSKIKQTCLERYGDSNYNNRSQYFYTIASKYSDIDINNIQSKFEKEVALYVKSICDSKIIFQDKLTILPYELDIHIPDLSLAIECNGNYWHNQYHRPKFYHYTKYKACLSKDIHLVQIYENEDYKTLCNYLFMTDYVDIHHCNIVQIQYFDKSNFYVHGNCFDIQYGIFYNNKLIAVVGFSGNNISFAISKYYVDLSSVFDIYKQQYGITAPLQIKLDLDKFCSFYNFKATTYTEPTLDNNIYKSGHMIFVENIER